MNRSSASIGTAELTPYTEASSTSQPNPPFTSSLPDPQRDSAPARSLRKRSNAATASSASGDRLPASKDRTAPAPIQSSKHGRSVSSPQRSPAGITATRALDLAKCAATAGAFRKHAVKVDARFTLRHRVLPFGDGRTRAVPAGIARTEAGEREYPTWERRPDATCACFSPANCAAEPSLYR